MPFCHPPCNSTSSRFQNWPRWRKESSFFALLLVVALNGVMKTAFISVNAEAANGHRVSYIAAAALTGVPLILSAFTGLISLVTSRICGKRPIYLISLSLVFIGTIWNTSVRTSYSQCLAARVFQGLGWGAFDTLVHSSIYDMFFVSPASLPSSLFCTRLTFSRNMNATSGCPSTPLLPSQPHGVHPCLAEYHHEARLGSSCSSQSSAAFWSLPCRPLPWVCPRQHMTAIVHYRGLMRVVKVPIRLPCARVSDGTVSLIPSTTTL